MPLLRRHLEIDATLHLFVMFLCNAKRDGGHCVVGALALPHLGRRLLLMLLLFWCWKDSSCLASSSFWTVWEQVAVVQGSCSCGKLTRPRFLLFQQPQWSIKDTFSQSVLLLQAWYLHGTLLSHSELQRWRILPPWSAAPMRRCWSLRAPMACQIHAA